ncbi:hypothetical protein PLICRDRAFT_537425 [Plicaturopsis crispa FD-325 SS-3]|nr:hypothetical protein PLICRDRAFT_537425 [Plicaturopsis crispa FD-325 SS-3]
MPRAPLYNRPSHLASSRFTVQVPSVRSVHLCNTIISSHYLYIQTHCVLPYSPGSGLISSLSVISSLVMLFLGGYFSLPSSSLTRYVVFTTCTLALLSYYCHDPFAHRRRYIRVLPCFSLWVQGFFRYRRAPFWGAYAYDISNNHAVPSHRAIAIRPGPDLSPVRAYDSARQDEGRPDRIVFSVEWTRAWVGPLRMGRGWVDGAESTTYLASKLQIFRACRAAGEERRSGTALGKVVPCSYHGQASRSTYVPSCERSVPASGV